MPGWPGGLRQLVEGEGGKIRINAQYYLTVRLQRHVIFVLRWNLDDVELKTIP